MPGPGAAKKANKSKPAPYDAGFLEEDTAELFDPNTIRAADKRGKNAGSKKKKDQPNGTDVAYTDEVTQTFSTSPSGEQTALSQILYSFPRRKAPADMLDVLSESVKVSDQYSTRTDAWAQDVPFGKSPPGNSIAEDTVDESPPIQGGYLGRGGFNTKTPPRSPAQKKARPVSYGSAIPPVPTRSEYGYRHSVSNYGSPPALPHMPQPHFYAAQDITLALGHQQQKEDTQSTFMAFRQLLSSPALPASASRTGVFVGSKGRLDILAASAEGKYEAVGALFDLPGDVIDAVALTWESGEDPFALQRPLVAVTIHGPTIAQEREASDNEFVATGMQGPYNAQTPQFETRVEVYSLKEQSLVVSLLRVPSVAFPSLAHGSLVQEPIGDLRLEAFGNSLVISSGVSGEVFACGARYGAEGAVFECLAKYWTNVQVKEQRRDSSHSRSPQTGISDIARDANSHQSAIYSGNGRWLAICPPGSAHRPSISAQVTSSSKTRASSTIDSRSPPARPSTSCAVESPDVETLLGNLARGAAQQVAKGAAWLGTQGLQQWNNYWNKDLQQPQSPPPVNNPYLYSPGQHPQQGLFPPTHATETVSREPDIVSIIDLKNFVTVATFQPPKGCSYLSFMPHGLGILTASKKGDVQYVWDLLQMKHVRSAALMSDGPPAEISTPRARQVAKFERLTSAAIVDVVWEPALGERFALVTKKGTIHLFDLPPSALRWPPPRRAGKIRPATVPSNPVSPDGPDAGLSGGFLASAINIASKAPPILASLRGRAPSIGQSVAGVGATGVGIASATGVRGGRAVAAGLSKSLGAATGTVQNLRHAGEGRLHVDSLAAYPAPDMVAWGRRGQKSIISILEKGSIKSHYISQAQTRDKNNKPQRISVFAKKAVSSRLPHISGVVANNLAHKAQTNENEDNDGPSGFWPTEPPSNSVAAIDPPHPLSHAEIDSNAPYQPFHSDPRVNLFVYSDLTATSMADSQLPTASTIFNGPAQPSPTRTQPPSEKWVFGEPISTTRLNLRSSTPLEDDDMGSVIYRDTSATTVLDKSGVPEQIVSTTRRMKTKRGGKSMMANDSEELPGDGDGFFEDDMDILDFAEDRV
jgi:hypothetical protein